MKFTKEHIKNLCIAQKKRFKNHTVWNKGKKMNTNYKQKLSESHKGYIMPKYQKQKISNSMKGKNKGKNNGMFGKHLSDETLQKMYLKKVGNKSHFWKGGKSFEKYDIRFNNNLRNNIRKKYNYKCQECSTRQCELKGRLKLLDIHHIDFNKKNNNENNLIPLCRSCHAKTNFNRNKWRVYFKNKLRWK